MPVLSAEDFLRVMDSGCKGRAWVENLRHRFSIFCSEADDIICKDSVNYVRTQLITAGENLMHMCSELVDGVLPDFSEDSARKNALVSPTQERDVNTPAQDISNVVIDTAQDGKSCTMNSASTLSSFEPVRERCVDIQSDGKDEVSDRFGKQTLDGDEYNVHAYSLSAQPPKANSSEKIGESKNTFVKFQEYELTDDKVISPSSGSTRALQPNVCNQQFPITESDQPCYCQKLEASIIMVNTDECYSDSDMETKHLLLENSKVNVCTLNKKLANECSFKSASQGIYSETDRITDKCCSELPCAETSRMMNEDFCDWEII